LSRYEFSNHIPYIFKLNVCFAATMPRHILVLAEKQRAPIRMDKRTLYILKMMFKWGGCKLNGNNNCRVELVPASRIKRMPGLETGVTERGVGKARDFAKKRGFCKPVVLSDSDGCMTLLAGAAAFEACLEGKEPKLPAVIVRTEGEADNLMFALQSAQLSEAFDAVAIGCAIVQLVDTYGITRKYIAQALGKSPTWINGMENVGRKLNSTVKRMVAEGHISSRSAQEIARLPNDVQAPFAVSASNELLSKENVIYLVNRYLNEDAGVEERDRIIRTPKLALGHEMKRRSRRGRDDSVSARLSRAMARCLDDAVHITNLLDRADIEDAVVSPPDGLALIDAISTLRMRLCAVFLPGEKND